MRVRVTTGREKSREKGSKLGTRRWRVGEEMK